MGRRGPKKQFTAQVTIAITEQESAILSRLAQLSGQYPAAVARAILGKGLSRWRGVEEQQRSLSNTKANAAKRKKGSE